MKVIILCAMHRLAREWAQRNKLAPDSFITATCAARLRGLPANTVIIVVDTQCKFEDSRSIDAVLKRFTNVTRKPFTGL